MAVRFCPGAPVTVTCIFRNGHLMCVCVDQQVAEAIVAEVLALMAEATVDYSAGILRRLRKLGVPQWLPGDELEAQFFYLESKRVVGYFY